MVAVSRRSSSTTDCLFFRHPCSLEIGEELPPKLHGRLDDGRYLVDLVLWGMATGREDRNGYVSLKAELLDKVMAKDDRRQLVDAMIDREVVERSNYEVGVKAFGYRLHRRFARDQHATTRASDRRLIRSLERFRAAARERQAARWLPVHFALAERQRSLRIDMDQAAECIAALPAESNPFDVQSILANDIHQGRYRLSVGTWGRVSNSITSMKREVRPALRAGGQKLQSVDIRNSQPAFLGQAAREANNQHTHNDSENGRWGVQNGDNDDLAKFVQQTSDGVFYESFADLMAADGYPALDRPVLKKRILQDVIAKAKPCNTRKARAARQREGIVDAVLSGAEYQSDVEDAFKRHIPTLYQFIRHVNKNGWEHENLIRLLQRREADLVIHRVAPGVMAKHSWLVESLHDSIFAPADQIGEVEKEFRAAFAERGIEMALKIEG